MNGRKAFDIVSAVIFLNDLRQGVTDVMSLSC